MTALASLVARFIAWRRRRARHQWRSTRGRAVEAEANAWENATEHPIVALFGGLEEVLAAQAVRPETMRALLVVRRASGRWRLHPAAAAAGSPQVQAVQALLVAAAALLSWLMQPLGPAAGRPVLGRH